MAKTTRKPKATKRTARPRAGAKRSAAAGARKPKAKAARPARRPAKAARSSAAKAAKPAKKRVARTAAARKPKAKGASAARKAAPKRAPASRKPAPKRASPARKAAPAARRKKTPATARTARRAAPAKKRPERAKTRPGRAAVSPQGRKPAGGKARALVKTKAEPPAPLPLAMTLPAPALPVEWTPDMSRPYPHYLELALTEQCNLRCVYCMNLDGIPPPAPEEEARLDEMLAVTRLCAERGVRQVWVTGGEPLLRKGVFQFLVDLERVPGVDAVHLTTNGILLKEALPNLERAKTRYLHIHLDSLKSFKYHRVTKQDWLYRVQEGLKEAEEAGFTRIGIHCTVLRGFNEDELVDFAMLTKNGPYQVRFAESLPRTVEPANRRDYLVTREEMFQRIDGFERLHRVEIEDGAPGMAYYRFDDSIGEVAFLGPHFDCVTPNGPRLRLSHTGELTDTVGGRVANVKELLKDKETGVPLLGKKLEEVAGLNPATPQPKKPAAT